MCFFFIFCASLKCLLDEFMTNDLSGKVIVLNFLSAGIFKNICLFVIALALFNPILVSCCDKSDKLFNCTVYPFLTLFCSVFTLFFKNFFLIKSKWRRNKNYIEFDHLPRNLRAINSTVSRFPPKAIYRKKIGNTFFMFFSFYLKLTRIYSQLIVISDKILLWVSL